MAPLACCGFEDFLREWVTGRRYITKAGKSNRRLSSKGTEEYKVVASKIAPTLRKKSVANAAGP